MLETHHCEIYARIKGCGLEICRGACSEVWLGGCIELNQLIGNAKIS